MLLWGDLFFSQAMRLRTKMIWVMVDVWGGAVWRLFVVLDAEREMLLKSFAKGIKQKKIERCDNQCG